MKEPVIKEDWPESWRSSYAVDLQEVFGRVTNLAYAQTYQLRRSRAMAAVQDACSPPATILDVAAAQGNFTLPLAELGYRVTWNDLRQELAGYVAEKYEFGSVEYTAGNIFEIEFDTPFDVVLMTEIIEHVAHPDEFLMRIAALVRPGGWVIITTPNGSYWRNKLPRFSDCPDPSAFEAEQFKPDADGHIFLLHEDELRALARQARLRVRKFEFFTNSLTAGHVKTAPLLNVLPRTVVAWLERRTQGAPGDVLRRRLNAQTLAVLQREA